MLKCGNKEILAFFEKDHLRNFYNCDNIVNAGKKGYAIKNIHFYTADGKPSDDYISFCENVFDELVVTIHTNNEQLINQALKEAAKIFNNYSVVRLGTADQNFFESKIFKAKFSVSKVYFAEYGVFACLSPRNLPKISFPKNVCIKIFSDLKKTEYLNYSDEEWDGLGSQIKYSNSNDKLFLITHNGVLSGYLLANNSYKNVYDISNVFVKEEFRGNNFGVFLTVFYANYCYDNQLLPHYGTAVSKYSEQVALKSGFSEISRTHFVNVVLL